MKERSLFASILLFFQLALSVTVGLLFRDELLLRIGTAASLLLPLLFLPRAPRPREPLRFAVAERRQFLYLLLFPAFVLLTAGVSIGTGALCRLFGLPTPGGTAMDTLTAAILLDACLPAVCEELFCRGALYSVLRPAGRRVAVLFTAILFALMHASPTQLPYALLAGILLAFLYELSGSLLFPILFHFGNNLLSLLLMFGASPVRVFPILGGAAAVGLCLFFLLARRSGLSLPTREERPWAPSRELLLSPLSAYILIMLLLSVL